MACKPGSVLCLRTEMAIPLGRSSPNASRDLPGRRRGNALRAVPIWSCSRWGLPCRLRCRNRGALLPHHFNLAAGLRRLAVSFLWRYPWSRLRRTLSGTVFPWSPDFPLPLRRAAIRPSDAKGMSGRYLAKSIFLSSAARMASHSASARPSILKGRQWRWKASISVSSRTSISGARP